MSGWGISYTACNMHGCFSRMRRLFTVFTNSRDLHYKCLILYVTNTGLDGKSP